MASIPLQVSGGVTVMVEIWKTAFGAREKTTDRQLKTTWWTKKQTKLFHYKGTTPCLSLFWIIKWSIKNAALIKCSYTSFTVGIFSRIWPAGTQNKPDIVNHTGKAKTHCPFYIVFCVKITLKCLFNCKFKVKSRLKSLITI